MSAERKIETDQQAAADASLEQFMLLKQQVAERLAAHRNRRGGDMQPPAPKNGTTSSARERTSRIAATVAERYAQSQSYRAFLAEESERSIRQAEAAAEIASLNARAVAEAQYDLLEQLDQYAAEPMSAAPVLLPPAQAAHPEPAGAVSPADSLLLFDAAPAPAFDPASLTVRHADELRLPGRDEAEHIGRRYAREIADAISQTADPDEAFSLDEEIAFRQSPVFESLEPAVEIPGNLIEFPRQLVAPRRARPRLAEGPLREEGSADTDAHQMRIFEVEAEQISSEPVAEKAAPEWSSMILDAYPRSAAAITVDAASHASYAQYDNSPNRPVEYATAGDRPAQFLERTAETRHLYSVPFEVAPIEQRLMAAAVDTCAVLAACMIFVAGVVLVASRFVTGGIHTTLPQAALAAAITLLMLSFAYQYLCFSFSDATPGMRYARIGLCSFADENPTRAAMLRRVGALALSAAPFGLGLLWALLDEDHLGWHDRISRMYQRSY